MVDSTSFVLEIRYYFYKVILKSLGIKYETFRDTKNRVGISFNYKGVKFAFYPNLPRKGDKQRHHMLLVETTTEKMLGKNVILESDLEEFTIKVAGIVKQILDGTEVKESHLSRVDFKVDVLMESQEMLDEYLKLLDKHLHVFDRMKEYTHYGTSVQLGDGSKAFNFYDKQAEREDKGYQDDEYQRILRIEVQLKKGKINTLEGQGLPRDLNYYWSKEAMEKVYFDYLEGYFYTGDYYKLNIAKEKVKASDYEQKDKKKLVKFLNSVNKYGLTFVIREYIGKNRTHRNVWSHSKAKEYIEQLSALGINPVTLNNDSQFDMLPNLLKQARTVCKRDYWK